MAGLQVVRSGLLRGFQTASRLQVLTKEWLQISIYNSPTIEAPQTPDKILNKKYFKSQIAQIFNRWSKVFKSLLDKDKDEQEDLLF